MKDKYALILMLFCGLLVFGTVSAYEIVQMKGGYDRSKVIAGMTEANADVAEQQKKTFLQHYLEQRQTVKQMTDMSQQDTEAEMGLSSQDVQQLQKKNKQSLQEAISGDETSSDSKSSAASQTQKTQSDAGKSASIPESVLPSCDCYDVHSPYTYNSNFLLDSSTGQRMMRKQPPCRCLPSQASSSQQQQTGVSLPGRSKPSVTEASSNGANGNGGASSSWDINY